MKNSSSHNFIIIIYLFCLSVCAAEWQGECVGVSDGDTIRVMRGKKEIKIRLYGIDCPERRQDFGTVARQYTSDLTFRNIVTVKEIEKDRYGRIVAYIDVDGTNVNRELIAAGLAWVYPQYCKTEDCNDWKELEEEARKTKRGLWAHRKPIPPWEWRKNKKR